MNHPIYIYITGTRTDTHTLSRSLIIGRVDEAQQLLSTAHDMHFPSPAREFLSQQFDTSFFLKFRAYCWKELVRRRRFEPPAIPEFRIWDVLLDMRAQNEVVCLICLSTFLISPRYYLLTSLCTFYSHSFSISIYLSLSLSLPARSQRKSLLSSFSFSQMEIPSLPHPLSPLA